MTTENDTAADDLATWLKLQRESLRVQVAHLGGIDSPVIRPLLEKQRQRDMAGISFRGEFNARMRAMRQKDMEIERYACW